VASIPAIETASSDTHSAPCPFCPAVINLPRSDRPGETGIPAIETAALLIVVVTTLGLGSATGPLLRYFDLEGKDDAALYGLSLTGLK